MLAPTPGCAGTPFWAFLGEGEGRSHSFAHQSVEGVVVSLAPAVI